jgi:hypothetical protein
LYLIADLLDLLLFCSLDNYQRSGYCDCIRESDWTSEDR